MAEDVKKEDVVISEEPTASEVKVTITPEVAEKIEEAARKSAEAAVQAKKEFYFHGGKDASLKAEKASTKALSAKFVADMAKGNITETVMQVHADRAKTISGGVDANGGFLVPEVFESEILATFDSYNEIIRNADVQSFNRPGRVFNLNELSTRVTSYFTDENSTGVTASTPTYSEPQIAIYDQLGTVDITEDFMEDTEADIMADLSRQFGETFASQLQSRLISSVITVSGVVMSGIFDTNVGAVTVSMSTTGSGYASVSAADLENMYFTAISIDHFQEANRDGAFYMDGLTMFNLRKNIRAATSDRDYLSLFDDAQMTILGRPVVITNQAPTPTTTTSNPFILYCNLGRHLKIRRKRGMTMKVNTSGTTLGGRNLNYQLGRELVVTQRIGHQVVLGEGMVHLVTK